MQRKKLILGIADGSVNVKPAKVKKDKKNPDTTPVIGSKNADHPVDEGDGTESDENSDNSGKQKVS
jgi:hypothetical protein